MFFKIVVFLYLCFMNGIIVLFLLWLIVASIGFLTWHFFKFINRLLHPRIKITFKNNHYIKKIR